MMWISFFSGLVIGIAAAVIMFTLLSRLDDLEREEGYRKWEEKSGYKVMDDDGLE